MPKGKKQEKILEEKTDKNSVQQNTSPGEILVKEQMKKLCQGLFYTSETDAKIEPFFGKQTQAATKQEVLSQTGNAPDASVEEKDFTQFFAPLTEIQDWFGDEEKEMAQKFANLRDLMKSNFRDLTVFKIGKVNLDIYAVGIDAENNLMGIKTKAVET